MANLKNKFWLFTIALSIAVVVCDVVTAYSKGSIVPLIYCFELLFGLILSVVAIVAFFRLVVERSWKHSVPVFISLFGIAVILYFPTAKIREALKADVIFLGRCEHTVSMAWIKLRKDKTFEYSPANFLNPELYEGTFEKKGDSVLLKFDDAEPTAKARLVFREKGNSVYLCELDSVSKVPHEFLLDSRKTE